MDLDVSKQNEITYVRPPGPRLDALQTLDFKEAMRKVVGESDGTICLDLASIEFMDSSGLGAIVSVSRIMGNDRMLELSHLQPIVAKVFRLTKMDSVFRIHNGTNA